MCYLEECYRGDTPFSLHPQGVYDIEKCTINDVYVQTHRGLTLKKKKKGARLRVVMV